MADNGMERMTAARGDTASTVRAAAERAGLQLVGESAAFQQLLCTLGRVARCAAATVLIHGETGTGKELVARALHCLGARSRFPFIPVNCGALPESLAENELFGHQSGAFTGASKAAAGLLHLAHGGTLFLDEVDSLPAKAQVSLLRFLQDGTFRPLGAGREERADVRIIAASNRVLEQEVKAGRFRSDLYYRLNLIAVSLPPLRGRGADAQLLAQHFLAACAERYALPAKRLGTASLDWLACHSWPGNIRELEHLIHREFILCDGDEIDLHAAQQPAAVVASPARETDDVQLTYRLAKSRAIEEFDRSYLTKLLKRTGGNITRAARLANKERRALGRLVKRYRIQHCDLAAPTQ